MSNRTAIAVLIVIALAAGIWALVARSSKPATRLIPAWQLLVVDRYGGRSVVDPFVSWAPDSRSLIFSESARYAEHDEIFRWKVGEKKLLLITEGISPNFVDQNDFIYFKDEPRGIYNYDLETGKTTQALSQISKSNVWNETTSFTYDPKRNTILLRLVARTRRYDPGTQEYDMDGNRVDGIRSGPGGNVVDSSGGPTGDRCAIVVDHGTEQTLEIADEGSTRGKEVASGEIGAVAWSHTEDLVAYGESSHVAVVRPDGTKTAVVARFDPPVTDADGRYISRLSWSPNGHYLAVLLYVVGSQGDYPVIYVLDMSSFKWDR